MEKDNKTFINNEAKISGTTYLCTEEKDLNIFKDYLKTISGDFELIKLTKKKSEVIKPKLKEKQYFQELISLLEKEKSKTKNKNNKNKATISKKMTCKNQISNLNDHKNLNNKNYYFDINNNIPLYENTHESPLNDYAEEKEINYRFNSEKNTLYGEAENFIEYSYNYNSETK